MFNEGRRVFQLNEQSQRSASLGCVTLIAVFFVALTAFGLAYQVKPSYFIDVGARADKPYVSGFNDREPDIKRQTPTDQTFRWTRADSYIDLPGLGSQDITVTLNLTASSNPDPQLALFVGDHQAALPQVTLSHTSYQQLSFAVPAAWFSDGNLHLKLVSHTFNPPGDARNLGVVLDWVRVEPKYSGFLPFVRPPSDSFLPLLSVAVLSVLILFSIGVPTPLGLLGGFGLIGGLAYWLINDRLSLTELIQQNVTESLFFLWIVAWVAAEFGPRLYKVFGVVVTRRESGWLAGLFLLQFGLLYVVMLHPQFATSDVGLDVNGLLRAEQGNYFFTTQLPNGLPQPYPPAYYLLLQPLAALTDSSRPALANLIELVNAGLEASGVFLIFYLSALMRQLPRRVTDTDLVIREEMEHSWEVGTNWAGLLAGAVYVGCRYTYSIFSQGNFTNLFGAWAFLLFVTVTAGTLGYFHSHHINLGSVKFRRVTTPATTPQSVPAEVQANIMRYARGRASSLPRTQELQTTTSSTASLAQLQSKSKIVAPLPPAPSSTKPEIVAVSELEAGDEPRFNLLQKALGPTAAYTKRIIWPRTVTTLRYLLPLILLLIVLTSHYGVFLFTNVFMLAAISLLLVFGGSKGRHDALYLAVIYGLAFGLAFLLYYSHFTDIIGQEISHSLGGAKGKSSAHVTDWGLVWRHLYSYARDDFGLNILLAALGGIILWLLNWWQVGRQATTTNRPLPATATRKSAIVGILFGRVTPLNALLLALFVTSSFFSVLSEVIGLESRYQLYILPLLALAAGSLLGRIWRSSLAGVITVTALLLFQLLLTVSFWLDLITYYPG